MLIYIYRLFWVYPGFLQFISLKLIGVEFFDGEQLHSLTGEKSEFIGKHTLLLSSLDFEDCCKSSAFESWGNCSIAELEAWGEVSQDTKSDEDPELTELLLSFEDIFDKPAMPPPSREEDHEIHLLPGSKPPPIRGIGEDQLALLKSTITELLDKGFIRPSTSPFSDESFRMCVDYRGLNLITIKNKAPLPNLNELRDRVRDGRIFSKMDLRDGFYNILDREEDRFKTAFRTRYGHFEFNVLPMGLTNSPATMQSTMNRIFGKFYDL